MASAWDLISSACGVIYFTAWSASFYPQIILNHKRRSALGLAPDFVVVNPIGFLCLTIWSFGAYFSPTARRQYAERHDGHTPQVSKSDLAFSAHALLLSTLTLIQSAWLFYRAHRARRNIEEESPLVRRKHKAPVTPHRLTRVALVAMAIATLWVGTSTLLGQTELLDLLYFASSLKIIITTIKYTPQLILNYKLKSVRGFAITTILADLTGGIFSLAQLVISSVFIDGQVAGIWANPGKLGLALLTIVFDIAFIVQHYVLYPNRGDENEDEYADDVYEDDE
ncbi:hypothetical protein CspeluHIS016_0801650 [Cutaneotrichosporon spelunceum]|uniref:PQ-loop-domain-containing protein n=1 Tax=Cutaneotrichosporon spelunceum TaxID=1672016 RepID=A0AAD3YEZ3_9TREE|nr:hypothetical protein CspeluHIS016_0801650 [Cutaneotrichosporon spelunceum]